MTSSTNAERVKSGIPDRQEIIALVKDTAKEFTSQLSFHGTTQVKMDGSFVTEVDRGIQTSIKQKLESNWPQYGFIGEEMDHSEQVEVCEKYSQGYWVLDPLDGTTNFTAGFLFYGVSLALVVNGSPVVAVVYDPVRDECFSAQHGLGSFLNDAVLTCPDTVNLNQCIANVDYKRLVGDLSAQLVRCPPYRSQRNLGSSVLEWCWLASGRIQLYLHGGQKLWDFSAGYLILFEAGGAATSLSGLPLDCSKLRKRSVVAAVNQQLLVKWVDWIDANSDIAQSVPF